jgi:hypothetical protein
LPFSLSISTTFSTSYSTDDPGGLGTVAMSLLTSQKGEAHTLQLRKLCDGASSAPEVSCVRVYIERLSVKKSVDFSFVPLLYYGES